MHKESWRLVEGFFYEISNFGKVWSYKTSKYLTLSPDSHGYLKVNLCKEGKVYRKYIHRLVVETFFAPIPKGLVVDHINGNISDNRWFNLQVVTNSQNLQKGNGWKTRKSKRKYVYYHRRSGKWQVCKRIEGKARTLAWVDTEQEAIAAAESLGLPS